MSKTLKGNSPTLQRTLRSLREMIQTRASQPSKAKQMRTDGDSNVVGDLSDSDDGEDSDEDLDAFFEKETQEEQTGDGFNELEEYIEP